MPNISTFTKGIHDGFSNVVLNHYEVLTNLNTTKFTPVKIKTLSEFIGKKIAGMYLAYTVQNASDGIKEIKEIIKESEVISDDLKKIFKEISDNIKKNIDYQPAKIEHENANSHAHKNDLFRHLSIVY
jgi:hypothetical protein